MTSSMLNNTAHLQGGREQLTSATFPNQTRGKVHQDPTTPMCRGMQRLDVSWRAACTAIAFV
jgi:hypothetical protein